MRDMETIVTDLKDDEYFPVSSGIGQTKAVLPAVVRELHTKARSRSRSPTKSYSPEKSMAAIDEDSERDDLVVGPATRRQNRKRACGEEEG
jgi:hypothetical protein